MEKLWTPSNYLIERSNINKFTLWLKDEKKLSFDDYNSLHSWSVFNISDFWKYFLEYSQIISYSNFDNVLSSFKMPGVKWFEGMELNFAENILEHNYQGLAIRLVIENNPEYQINLGYKSEYSFKELKEYIHRCANSLRSLGIQKGSRVAGYIANVPEAIICSLACASIGATWSSASPDFGVEAVCDRFIQVQPKIVFASTHYVYNGKQHDNCKKILELKERIESIQQIISIPYPTGIPSEIIDMKWDDFLSLSQGSPIKYERTPFSHPLYIMFSSGTTGVPKCIVHSAGGTLLQHLKELNLHCDIKPNDKLMYYTTTGWMMWNWQLSALALGCSIHLYEGSTAFPKLNSLFETASQNKITHLGTSGRYIESCMKANEKIDNTGYKDLKCILYTGSPLSEHGFRWIYQTIKSDLHLAGISGGTDIISCFVLGNPTLPVFAGRIQCKGLGIDAVALDENGSEIVGSPGELVCRKPIPSMPVKFLNDPNNEKYLSGHFKAYSGVWSHGDYIEFDENGSSIIYGRSDATLNPGGVRIGVAEIYSALDNLKYINGSLAVGWKPQNQSDEEIVLFVVLAGEKKLDKNIEAEIRSTLRRLRSPKHSPKYIFQISEVPTTRSGKPVELSLKAILANKDIQNISSLSNPHILDEVRRIRDTQLSC